MHSASIEWHLQVLRLQVLRLQVLRLQVLQYACKYCAWKRVLQAPRRRARRPTEPAAGRLDENVADVGRRVACVGRKDDPNF